MARNDDLFRITYDPEADALTIHLAKGRGRVGTKELDADHNADYDSRGRLVALEVLNASRHYKRAALERLPNPVEWLTLAEAAAESGLQADTLRSLINKGRLPAVKRGRDWLVAMHVLWNYLEGREPRGRPGGAPRKPRRSQTHATVHRGGRRTTATAAPLRTR